MCIDKDVMERARDIWSDAASTYEWAGSTGHYHQHIENTIARALAEYGDQRAREAETAIRDKLLALLLCDIT
jgi:hypothetical protein